MFFEIDDHQAQSDNAVLRMAERQVAPMAENAADFAGLMIVVEIPSADGARVVGATTGASLALAGEHSIPLLFTDAVAFVETVVGGVIFVGAAPCRHIRLSIFSGFRRRLLHTQWTKRIPTNRVRLPWAVTRVRI